MGRRDILVLLLGVALGANVVLGAIVVTSLNSNASDAAWAQTVDSGAGYTVATGQLQSRGSADALYILDHASKKLCVYFENGKTLELLHVRDVSEELGIKSFGLQDPPYGELKKAMKRKKGKG